MGRLGASAAAGIAYFSVVFAVGFLLGTIRVLILTPLTGEALATLVELPMMLALSWFACRWLLERFAVPPRWSAQLLMGGLAFGLLMLGELLVSVLGFGRSLSQHLSIYRNPLAAIGLAAQVLFALFPLVQCRLQRKGPQH